MLKSTPNLRTYLWTWWLFPRERQELIPFYKLEEIFKRESVWALLSLLYWKLYMICVLCSQNSPGLSFRRWLPGGCLPLCVTGIATLRSSYLGDHGTTINQTWLSINQQTACGLMLLYEQSNCGRYLRWDLELELPSRHNHLEIIHMWFEMKRPLCCHYQYSISIRTDRWYTG